MGGVGIQLGDLDGDLYLAGVDLDSCLENGILTAWAAPILEAIQSYAEISPSGTGLKAFFYLETDHVRRFLELNGVSDPAQWGFSRSIPGERSKKDHGPGIELYTANRYFAATGNLWPDQPDQVTTLDWPALERLAALIPSAQVNDNNGAVETLKAAVRQFPFRCSVSQGCGAEARRKTFDEMVNALGADPDTSEWVREKGELNGQRELHRTWEKTVKAAASSMKQRSPASPHSILSNTTDSAKLPRIN